MTRFARTRGLKQSAEQMPEEPTPWEEMVSGMDIPAPVQRQERQPDTATPESLPKKKGKKRKATEAGQARPKKGGWTVSSSDDIPDAESTPGVSSRMDESTEASTAASETAEPTVKKGKKKKKKKADSTSTGKTEANDGATVQDATAERPKKKGKKKKQPLESNQADSSKKPSDSTDDDTYVYTFTKYLPDGMSVRLSKFQGVTVLPDDCRRLNKLQKSLMSRGVPFDSARQVLTQERRLAERAMKRYIDTVCLRCRGLGHKMAACPQRDESQDTAGICFRCGAPDHTSKSCPKSTDEYEFAQCFVCGKSGHISRQCPDNPKGLYPKGGSCRNCGDVTHLARDCPERQRKNQEYRVTADRFANSKASLEDVEATPIPYLDNKGNAGRKKIVKF